MYKGLKILAFTQNIIHHALTVFALLFQYLNG